VRGDRARAERPPPPRGAGARPGPRTRAVPPRRRPAPTGWMRNSGRKCWRGPGRGLLPPTALPGAVVRRGRGMDSLTKVSGVAVSMLVAATASVLLVLPTQPRLRTSRGAGMAPAIMVASATARPPAGQPLAVGGAAHRCLPPAAPLQHCRVSGDSTGGTRAATAGRRRCRHGPLAAHPGGTGTQPGGTGQAHAGSAQAGSAQAGSAQAGSAQAGSAQAGSAQAGSAQAGSGQCCPAATPAAPRRKAGQPADCLAGIPRRPR
jgi:hypothetical protein